MSSTKQIREDIPPSVSAALDASGAAIMRVERGAAGTSMSYINQHGEWHYAHFPHCPHSAARRGLLAQLRT